MEKQELFILSSVSLLHNRQMCFFLWRVGESVPKTGRDRVKGFVVYFANLPHRCPPLHFKTRALKSFYVHGHFESTIKQETIYSGP